MPITTPLRELGFRVAGGHALWLSEVGGCAMGRVSGVLAAGVVAVALSVAGAGPAAAATTPSASGTVFVHSARSGELGGGRLTLRGVGRLVTWSQPSGRSGVLSITRINRLTTEARCCTRLPPESHHRSQTFPRRAFAVLVAGGLPAGESSAGSPLNR